MLKIQSYYWLNVFIQIANNKGILYKRKYIFLMEPSTLQIYVMHNEDIGHIYTLCFDVSDLHSHII
jgi:hypothetical protein